MKKQIITVIALAGALIACKVQAQGTIDLTSFDSQNGNGFNIIMPGGSAGVASDFASVQVLGGPSAGSLTPIVSVALGTSIYPIGVGGAGAGAFDASWGAVTGVGANTLGFFEILVWQGAADFATARTLGGAYWADSGVFTSTTGSINNAPAPTTPGQLVAPIANLQLTLNPVPEPATFALAGLGAAALMIFRRRK